MHPLVDAVVGALAAAGGDDAAVIRRVEGYLAARRGELLAAPLARRPLPAGRYLCHRDERHGFVVMLFVWEPGDATPIHNHGTWGVETVLRGSLRITLYDAAIDPPRATERIYAGEGRILHNLPPDHDVHMVENPTETTAVSLHVYGRAMSANLSYEPGRGFVPRDLPLSVLEDALADLVLSP